jgi:hypothetical protein
MTTRRPDGLADRSLAVPTADLDAIESDLRATLRGSYGILSDELRFATAGHAEVFLPGTGLHDESDFLHWAVAPRSMMNATGSSMPAC